MDPDWLRRGAVAAEFLIEEGCFITEYLNEEACPAASVALARVPEGVRTRLHALQDITERHVVLSGRGLMEVAGEAAEIGPGDTVVVAPGIPQRVTALESALVFLCICMPRFRDAAYRDLEPG
jgi:mannose-6-phosphate isomerase-like protein (cupin superfamily)